jgi:hypothetical protein
MSSNLASLPKFLSSVDARKTFLLKSLLSSRSGDCCCVIRPLVRGLWAAPGVGVVCAETGADVALNDQGKTGAETDPDRHGGTCFVSKMADFADCLVKRKLHFLIRRGLVSDGLF